MTRPQRWSHPRPGSAECRNLPVTPADDDVIRAMARRMRRERGLVLIDPSRISDPIRRELVEQVADDQLGARR